MKLTARIYVAGHTGLIGSAMLRRLEKDGYSNIVIATHSDLELTDAEQVDRFFAANELEFVVLAAGKVGGIIENKTYPADFMNANLAIQLNVFKSAHKHGIKKLIFFASSCMYPRECPQPMPETALLSGQPESTSMAYAVSKLAGMQMCLAYNAQYGKQCFLPVIPNSAFGPNDNFNPDSGHVLSALIRRFHDAKLSCSEYVTLWGTGTPRREFVHADDIAGACVSLLSNDTSGLQFPINIGTGCDISIKELAEKTAKIVGYTGKIIWDTSKPDGAPRKLLDSSRIRSFGWTPSVDLDEGLKTTYQWYLENVANMDFINERKTY